MPPRKVAAKSPQEAPAAPPSGQELHALILALEAASAAYDVARDAYWQAREQLVAALKAMGLERWPP
jgi:hypothetical protein